MADAMAALKMQAVGEWDVVGDVFFAREHLYDMAWDDLDPADKRLAMAPFGGPIAAIRDERRIVLVSHTSPPAHAPALGTGPGGGTAAGAGGGGAAALGDGGLKPVLRTFTAAGGPLGAAVWEGGRLVDWGWSAEQELVTVEASGKVTVFSPFAEKLREFSFGEAVQRDGVAAALVAGGVVAVVTEPRMQPPPPQSGGGAATAAAAASTSSSGPAAPGSFWVVTDLHDPRPVRLAPIPAAAYGSGGAAGVGGIGGGPGGGGSAAAGLFGGGIGGLRRPGLPDCFAVLQPQHTLSSGVEVLAVAGGALWQLDERTATDHHPAALRAAGGAMHVAVSPDGAFVALHTADDRLLVLSADLTRQLSEFETRGAEGPPAWLAWVGSDAVLLAWPGCGVVVGAYGDAAQWAWGDEVAALVAEVDGCRLLLGRSRQELVRRVADATAQVFRPGATGPAAQLWDARALYEDQNPRCDKLLRGIQDAGPSALPAAVRTCIEAAGHDLSPLRQRALMRAAAYGRPFCPPDFPRQLMYGIACRLRLLNAVREPRVGLPLTLAQLEALSLPVLVARLISYRQWLLAYRIAGVLRHVPGAQPPPPHAAAAAQQQQQQGGGAGPGPGPAAAPPALAMGQDAVLVQWACAKISAAAAAAVDDGQLKDAIVAKLKGCPQVRYAPLAAHALSLGRRRLALRLLEEERSAAQQVPLLLSLAVGAGGGGAAGGGAKGGRPALPDLDDGGEGGSEDVMQRALKKAIESGDTDLVYLVLFGLYRARPLPEFWAAVAARALSRNLFIKYCRQKEPELLETILTAAAAGGPSPAAAAAGSSAATASSAAGAGSAAATAAALAFPPPVAAAELASLQLRGALAEYVAAATAAARQQAAGGAGGGSGGAEAANARLLAQLGDVSAKYAQNKDTAFQSRAVADMAALRREQARLERETGQRLFVGLSLADTLRAAIRLGHHKAAAALKKQFAVTDRRFAWIKVRTLAEAHDWEALEAFAAELRRSPIGWEPFLEAAKQWNAPLDARARLVARLPDSPAKAEEYSAMGLAREAAEVAAKIKDTDLFARIQSAVAAGSPAALAIAQIKERFATTFR